MQPQDQHLQPKNSLSAAPGGYISAVDAAVRFNLTNDHIASLVRKGKVQGVRVGRSWFVSPETLEAYVQKAHNERQVRKSALSEQLKREYQERAPTPVPAPVEPTPTSPEWKPVVSPIQFAHKPFAKRTSQTPIFTVVTLFFLAGVSLSSAAHIPQTLATLGSDALAASAAAVPEIHVDVSMPDLSLPPADLFVESLGEHGLAAWDATFGALGSAIVDLSQNSIASSMTAVATLYTEAPQTTAPQIPVKEPSVFTEENIQLVAQTPAIDTTALTDAAWHMAAIGNVMFDTSAHIDAQPQVVLESEFVAADAYVGTVAPQENKFGAPVAVAAALISLPYEFLTDMTDSFIDEMIAVHHSIAHTLDAVSNVQNHFYEQYIAAVYEAGDMYTAVLGNISTTFVQTVEPIGDTAAAVYGTSGNIFVKSVDDIGNAQADAYTTLAGAATPHSETIELSAATVEAIPDTYAGLVGTIGGVFVATVYEIPNTYAALVGGIGNAFVEGTDVIADVYAAVVGNVGTGFVKWVDALIGSQADIYAILGNTTPHLWSDTFGGFGKIFVKSVDQLGDAQADAYLTLAGGIVGGINAGSSNFSTAAAAQAADTQAGWNVVWGGWTTWLAQKLYGMPKEVVSVQQTAAQILPASNSAPEKSSGRLTAQSDSVGFQFFPLQNSIPAPTSVNLSQPSAQSLTSQYVTQVSLTEQLSQLSNSLKQLIYTNQPAQSGATIPWYIAAGGNSAGVAPSAAGGVTIVNNITNNTGGSSATALSGLTDVSVSSPAWGSLLSYNGSAWAAVATSSLGIVGSGGSSFGYLFPSNATTTGLGIFASSTIGSGAQAGGLTVSGGATTTGNAYVAGNVGVGTTTPDSKLSISNGNLHIGNTAGTNQSNVIFDRGALPTLNNLQAGIGYITNGGVLGNNESFVFNTGNTGNDYRFKTGGTDRLVINGTNGNIGIGTTSPYAKLSVVGSIVAANFIATTTASSTFAGGIIAPCFSTDGTSCIGSGGASLTGTVGQLAYFSGSNTAVGTSTMYITPAGNVAIGTTSPYAKLTVWGGSSTAGNALEVANSASTSILTVSNAGLFSVGSNGSNAFTVDAASGSTTIANLSIGNLNFDINAGVVALSNIPVDSNASAGVIQSQSLNIGDQSVLTAYGESDGAGGVQNLRVGIGTTSPFAALAVVGRVVASYFTATTTATSTFPWLSSTYATTTSQYITGLATAAGAFLAVDPFGKIIATTTPSGSGSSFSYLFPSNATTTALGFYASTTIGNGSQASGLTISGGATTTGDLLVQGSGVINGRLSLPSGTSATAGAPTLTLGLSTSGLYADTSSSRTFISAAGVAAVSVGTNGLAVFRTGSAASPSIHNNNSTGLFFPSAGELAVTANGIETVRFSSSQNVGIGTTSPYAKLSVVGDVVAARFVATTTATSTFAGAIQASCFSLDGTTCITSGGATNFYATTTIGDGTQGGGLTISGGATTTGNAYFGGNIGIATNKPSASLDIANGNYALGTNPTIQIGADIGATTRTNNTRKLGSFVQYPYANANMPFSLLSADSYDASTQLVDFGGGFTGYSAATELRFFTAATVNTGAGTQRMVVDKNGNVGIGTTSPNSILSVRGGNTSAAVNTGVIQVGASQGQSNAGLEFGVVTLAGTSRGFLQGFNFATGVASDTVISPFGGNTLINPGSGNVGIGTTSPYVKLSVVGDVVAARFVATTTATSTFAGAIQASCFSTNGTTCLTSGGGGNNYASTTIGDGTQVGGLTISGGATTTGRAYFASALSVGMNNASAGVFIGQQDSSVSPFSVYAYQPSGSFTTVTLTYTTAVTWTKPAGLDHIVVQVWGGGGGGGGWNGGPYAGGSGGTSSFTYSSGGSTVQATGGAGGAGNGNGGSGGSGSGGDTNSNGTSGGGVDGGAAAGAGGAGGTGATTGSPSNGGSAPGGGGGSFNNAFTGGGGGGGGYSTKTIAAASLGTTETVRVGGGGGGGDTAAGGGGNNYGAGGGGAGSGGGSSASSNSTTGGNGGTGFAGAAGSGGTAGNAGGDAGGNSAGSVAAGGGGGGAGTQGSLSSDATNYTYNNGGAGGHGGDCTSSCNLSGAGGGGGGNASGGASGVASGVTHQSGAGGAGGKVVIVEYFPASNILSATPTLTVSNTGNIGIGTSSPLQAFIVQAPAGVTPFTIASSTGASLFSIDPTGSTTIANGINITSGCFAVNGTCLTSGGTVNLYASTTIGNGTLGLTVSGPATTTGRAYFAGLVGIASTSPFARLSVDSGSLAAGVASFVVGSSTRTDFIVTQSGNVGFGTSNPGGMIHILNNQAAATKFIIQNTNGSGQQVQVFAGSANQWNFGQNNSDGFFKISYDPNGSLNTNTVFTATATGLVGIGTTSPYAKLSVVGEVVGQMFTATSTTATSTFNGGLNVGSGQLTYDLSTGVTSINNLAIGGLNFDTDAGIVSWADLPISSSASAGTVESYTANIGGTPIFTIYGEADGSGNAQNGRVGIGTTTPAYLLDVASTTGAGVVARFTNASGSCTINPNTTSLTCSSDERLKKNIIPITATSTLLRVLGLDPVYYNWNNEGTTSAQHAGFIAQRVEEIFPDLVSQDDSGYYGVNYGGFAPYFASAIQEIANIGDVFRDKLVAWFADTKNGITKLFAKEVHTEKLCVGDVCVTQEQFLAMVNGAGGGNTPPPQAPVTPPEDDNATSTPPVIDDTSASSTPPVVDEPAEDTPPPVVETPPAETPPAEEPAPDLVSTPTDTPVTP